MHYDFDTDLQKSKTTEREVAELFKSHYGNDIRKVSYCDDNRFDIALDMGDDVVTLEVKEDFKCMVTGNVCVEFECRGKPSGIAVTQADYLVYKIHESPVKFNYYMCSIDAISKRIASGNYYRVFESGGDPGSNTKGYLFKLADFKNFTKRIRHK